MKRVCGLVASLLLSGALLLSPFTAAASARRAVPYGFLGVMADGPLLNASLPQATIDSEFDQMVRTGVESVRIGVYWSAIQPYAPYAPLPPSQASRFQDIDGAAYDFTPTDRLYAAAAARGLVVLPVIVQAPPWARKHPTLPWSPPSSAGAYGAFVGTVVQRYGPAGTFWAAHPGLPARATREWQIWNEPAGGQSPDGYSSFWQDPGVPFEATYLAMLQAAREEIKAVDPQAQVVLGGLFGKGWLALQDIYANGGRGLFDAVAIDMYTRVPEDVIRALRLMRGVMNANGDGQLPLMVTEFSWPSALGRVPGAGDQQFGYDVTAAQQAQRLLTALKLFRLHRRELGLQQVFWYTWVTTDSGDSYSFDYAGLRQFDGPRRIVSKPAQGTYRAEAIRLEGCAKRAIASACR